MRPVRPQGKTNGMGLKSCITSIRSNGRVSVQKWKRYVASCYSTAAVIQAACNIITVAINGSADKEGAMQATQRWMKTSRERAKARDHSTHYRKQYVYS
jgi:hypothetical protein